MQIVIDIPEVYYEALRKTDEITSSQQSGKTLMSVIYDAVGKGTPLPEGHGRLIDENKINKCKQVGLIIKNGDIVRCLVTDTPTIIEADKIESEE